MSFRLAFLVISFLPLLMHAQSTANYDTLVQEGNKQLQAGDLTDALAKGNRAIALDRERWQAYALSGGALMNLKRYEEAADSFSKAIEFAPVAKQASLRDLRKQCALAESNPVPSSPAASPVSVSPSATQSEVVLWKSIESSTNRADYDGYLKQYPSGTFATLAHGRIDQITKDEDLRATREAAARQEALRQAGTDFGVCLHHLVLGGFQDNGCGRLNVHPGAVSFSDDKASDGFTASCSEIQQPTLQNSRFFTGKRFLLLIVSGRKIAVEASQPSVLDNILQHIQSECPK